LRPTLNPKSSEEIFDDIRAAQVEIDARDEQRGRTKERRRYVAALEAAGVPVLVAPVVAEVLVALFEAGWAIGLAIL
jgi:hypothetical protein